MNYYPFHIGDYVSATRHLSWEEDAAFRRLLDTYYITEKAIPAEPRAACRLVMAQTESQREAVRVVLEEFFVLTPEGWVNKRADAEIVVMREKQQKQRDKANKRWDMQRTERGNAAAQQTDTAASKTDADAMPPTPTPTPTPTPVEEKKEARKRAAPLARPADVDGEVWDDWLALRKAKRAPVSPTVVAEAEREAGKAGLTLEAFLRVWCARGSQGLQADWLKPAERGQGPPTETAYARQMREKYEQVCPEIAAKKPGSREPYTVDMEPANVVAIRVG